MLWSDSLHGRSRSSLRLTLTVIYTSSRQGCRSVPIPHRPCSGMGRDLPWVERGGKGSPVAVVDNRLFPQECQRPTMSGVTVGQCTSVVKITYGTHPRLSKTLTQNALGQLSAMVYSVDCCAIGECGLDYTELLSLPSNACFRGKLSWHKN